MEKTINMEIGTLFELKGKIYEVIDNPEKTCEGCAGFKKTAVQLSCKLFPFCGGIISQPQQVKFKKLNTYEIRQAKKSKKEITKLS